MALNFNRQSETQVNNGAVNQNSGAVQQADDITDVVPFDIVQDRTEMTAKYENSAEIDRIASQIEVYNMDSIVSFGSEAADEIAKSSDLVIRSMNMSQINDSGELLNALAKIMDKFDIKEIKENEANPNFWTDLNLCGLSSVFYRTQTI